MGPEVVMKYTKNIPPNMEDKAIEFVIQLDKEASDTIKKLARGQVQIYATPDNFADPKKFFVTVVRFDKSNEEPNYIQ